MPFEGQPGWTREPLAPRGDGDRLYGRGTCDMKGFVAQCLAAARRLDRGSLERPLVFVFTCDEEIGCLGAERLAPALAALLGEIPLPRALLDRRADRWRVAYAHKGIVQLDVVAHGRGGHSSVPEAGVNAIALAARAMAAIGELQAERARARRALARRRSRTRPTRPSTSARSPGGTAANVIAEECRFRVSYRPLPDEDPLAAYARGASGSRARSIPRLRLARPARRARAPARLASCPGLLSPRGTALEKALRAVLGDHEPGGAPFCTDGGRLAARRHRLADLRPGRARAGAPAGREPVARRVRERLASTSCG